ncbi:MAG: universal stress protein [Gemmatimonadaceae bacterium]
MAAATIHPAGVPERAVTEALVQEGTRWLDRVVAAGIAGAQVRTHVTFGKPGDALLACATADAAQLLVVGRRGSGLHLAGLGSTVSVVLHGATCPVLVVSEDA